MLQINLRKVNNQIGVKSYENQYMVQIEILYADIKSFQALKLKLLDKNKFLMLETLRAKKKKNIFAPSRR